MVLPLKSIPKVKKHPKKFLRPYWNRNFRLGTKWRNPRGIDSDHRRNKRGNVPKPSSGYGTDKRVRGIMKNNGFYKVTINSAKELEMLKLHNKKFAAEIAHGVGIRKRLVISKRAKELNIYVTNSKAKLQKQEN